MRQFLDEEAEEAEQVRAREEIRGWPELQEQIKEDQKMAQKQKASPTRINQLMILRNFATLRIKGFGRMATSQEIARQWHEGKGVHFSHQIRILARHYQRFEQLPVEKRGGEGGQSLINDEQLQKAALTYLSSVPTGEVTPKEFHRTLNKRILPVLGYMLRAPLSEHIARQWLIKLGWRRTVLRKGVYMDSHERDDVKEYRCNVFLPLVKSFERRMVEWVPKPQPLGPGLMCKDPELNPGEKRVIALFQDESSFHVNEFKQTAWYALWS